ncbi:5-hydroxytryptamine receptor 3C [Prionailurus iriomotensis]
MLSLIGSLLTTGKGDTFTINCSGFDQHGVDPAAFQAVFDRKAFRPVINDSIPTRVNISFTLSAILEVKCTAPASDVIPVDEFDMDVDRAPPGLTVFVSSEGQMTYDRPVRVTSICNLDIFYFPFDQQNCTFTFSSFLYTVDSMLLGMDKEVWEITDTSRNLIQTQGEWELLGINKATPKMLVGSNLYDQIMFYVAIRRRPSLYIINLLVPSGFLVAIDALSFYLPAESETRAPFKITLLLGYNVFLLMMNDLLPATGTPLISVYFALCLSLMVISLLETIFIIHLSHMAATQPPPMPWWLHSLLLNCASPRKCCTTAPGKGNKGFGLTLTHLHGMKKPVELVEKVPGARGTGLNGCPGSTRAQQEDEAQKQHLVDLWVQFSHMMDTLLFRLYLLFTATSIITVIVLWNT